jgi:phosphate transport system substrate-binding protein
LASHPPDERLTLVNAPGANAYPLINYEYAVVSKKQPSPETAAALRSFLLWVIAPDETNAQYLADAHFIPRPPTYGCSVTTRLKR